MSNIENAVSSMGIEEMPTLKAFANAMEVPYQRLRSVAKQPEAGKVYDPNQFNWDAVTRFIERRIGDDCQFTTLEEVVDAAVEADKLLQSDVGSHRAYGRKVITLPNGDTVPERRHTFEVGDITRYKKNLDNFFTVVFTSSTHVVLQPNNGSPELVCLSNSTVNAKLVPPAKLREAVDQDSEDSEEVEDGYIEEDEE